MRAVVDHGARFIGSNVMHLEGGTRDHFMRWLEAERPELVDGYRQLYTSKYATKAYREEVKKVMSGLRAKCAGACAATSSGEERVGATRTLTP